MTLSFRSIDDVPAEEWDELVQTSPDGWVFGLHGWQRLVADVEAWGFVDNGFGVYEGDRLQAVVPLHLQPSSNIAGSSGWGGSGPVIRGSLPPERRQQVFRAAVARMIEIAEAAGAIRLDVSSSPVTASSIGSRWAINPFALLGFDDSSLISQVISLEPSESDLWHALSKTARNLVRRGEKAGFRVEPADWLISLDAYYDIHVETYARTGVAPHPKRYFEGIATAIAPSGASRLLALISPDGEPVAFHGTVQFGNGANYHIGCSRTAVQSLSPSYLLMWEAIKAAKASGAGWFDVGWIFPATDDRKQKGLTHFKTRFGGEPHRSFRAELGMVTRVDRTEPTVDEAPGIRDRTFAIAGRFARRARRFLAAGTPP
ncbi:MAG: lipid II:glycine glycyltransferase FemX [Geminicoccaceae bacterium]